jgi:hypothetical protein
MFRISVILKEREMAKYPLDSQQALTIGDDTTLKVRLKFFKSELYRDFQSARVMEWLTSAAAAQDDSKRSQLIRSLAEAGDLVDDAALKRKVNWARTLFSAAFSAQEKLTLALGDTEALAYAQNWEPSTLDPDYRTLEAVFGTTPPTWPSRVGATAFKSLADQLIVLGLKAEVKNPLVAAVLDFWTNVKALAGSDATWSDSLCMVAARSRLGALWSESDVGTFDATKVEAHCLKQLLKLASRFCGNSSSDGPRWLEELKKHQQGLEEKRKPKLRRRRQKQRQQRLL